MPINRGKSEIQALQDKFQELEVKINEWRDKRRKATNERTNILCSNCKKYGHLATECRQSLGDKSKLRDNYCGAKEHDITTCKNIREVKTFPK